MSETKAFTFASPEELQKYLGNNRDLLEKHITATAPEGQSDSQKAALGYILDIKDKAFWESANKKGVILIEKDGDKTNTHIDLPALAEHAQAHAANDASLGSDKKPGIVSALAQLKTATGEKPTAEGSPAQEDAGWKQYLPMILGGAGLLLGAMGGDIIIGLIIGMIAMFALPAILSNVMPGWNGFHGNSTPAPTPGAQQQPQTGQGQAQEQATHQPENTITTLSAPITRQAHLNGKPADATIPVEYAHFPQFKIQAGNLFAEGGLVGKTITKDGEKLFEVNGMGAYFNKSGIQGGPLEVYPFQQSVTFHMEPNGSIDATSAKNKEASEQFITQIKPIALQLHANNKWRLEALTGLVSPQPTQQEPTPQAPTPNLLQDSAFKADLKQALTDYLDPHQAWVDPNDPTKLKSKPDMQLNASIAVNHQQLRYTILQMENQRGKSAQELLKSFDKPEEKAELEKKIDIIIEAAAKEPDREKAFARVAKELTQDTPSTDAEKQQLPGEIKKQVEAVEATKTKTQATALPHNLFAPEASNPLQTSPDPMQIALQRAGDKGYVPAEPEGYRGHNLTPANTNHAQKDIGLLS